MKKIGYNTNAKLHDKVVDVIRQRLDSQLSWLNYSYPIAEIGINESEEVEYTFPQIYAGGGKYYDIRPDWDVGAYCFFEFIDSRKLDEDNYEYDLAVIFYVRLDKAVPSKNNRDYTSELMDEVIAELRHPTIDARVVSWDIRPETIFENYTDLDRIKTQGLMKYGTAFKIYFTVNHGCY